MSAHENLEHAEHAEHAAHGGNKGIALLIAVMALFLAFSETLGKSAQTEGIGLNIKASDTWNFFQAKTIRQTALRTAAENGAVLAVGITDPAAKEAMLETITRRLILSSTNTNATPSSRAIITTRSPRPPSRLPSFWHPRPLSPAWWCCHGSRAVSA